MLFNGMKKLIPIGFRKELRSYLYFKGLLGIHPKVYNISVRGKTLYLSNTIDITHWDRLEIGNNSFIWHFTILDTFNGIKIGDDCQIGTRVGIFTHSSHNSIRYYNSRYHDVYFDDHKGRLKGGVEIGDCTFVGANSIIMPNTKIGKGCIVAGFSYVQGKFDDYSIIAGNPAKKVGDVRVKDHRFLKNNPDICEYYLKYFGYSSIDDMVSNIQSDKK